MGPGTSSRDLLHQVARVALAGHLRHQRRVRRDAVDEAGVHGPPDLVQVRTVKKEFHRLRPRRSIDVPIDVSSP
jgi:hypothetical protein